MNSDRIGAIRSKVGEVATVVIGVWFWSAFIAMFFVKKYPAIEPYVGWSFRLFAAIFVCFILGIVVYSIGYGARETYGLYRFTLHTTKAGWLGRILWAIVFVL